MTDTPLGQPLITVGPSHLDPDLETRINAAAVLPCALLNSYTSTGPTHKEFWILDFSYEVEHGERFVVRLFSTDNIRDFAPVVSYAMSVFKANRRLIPTGYSDPNKRDVFRKPQAYAGNPKTTQQFGT